MKQVLIISPTFLPNTSADMQRVRMMLPHLAANGWRATVVAADPAGVSAPVDSLLEKTLDSSQRICRYKPLSQSLCSSFGLRNLGWRSLVPLQKLGSRLLREESYDCILFSSTIFSTWLAAPSWARTFAIPYILDFQDPWWRFEPRSHRAPGHPLKAAVATWLARRYEPRVVEQASGIITVSPQYRDGLRARYPHMLQKPIEHIPFSASHEDFELLATVRMKNPAFEPSNKYTNYVYVGRLGSDMIPALNALFRSFAEYVKKQPEQAKKIRFHFVGTSYAPPEEAKLSAMPIAMNWQLGDYAIETPHRIPYLQALQVIKDSDGVLILGSTDAAYSPSKLFPALVSEKPILCLAAKDSVLASFISEHQVPALLWDYTYANSSQTLFAQYVTQTGTPFSQLTDSLQELASADSMTSRVCAVLDSISSGGAP